MAQSYARYKIRKQRFCMALGRIVPVGPKRVNNFIPVEFLAANWQSRRVELAFWHASTSRAPLSGRKSPRHPTLRTYTFSSRGLLSAKVQLAFLAELGGGGCAR